MSPLCQYPMDTKAIRLASPRESTLFGGGSLEWMGRSMKYINPKIDVGSPAAHSAAFRGVQTMSFNRGHFLLRVSSSKNLVVTVTCNGHIRNFEFEDYRSTQAGEMPLKGRIGYTEAIAERKCVPWCLLFYFVQKNKSCGLVWSLSWKWPFLVVQNVAVLESGRP